MHTDSQGEGHRGTHGSRRYASQITYEAGQERKNYANGFLQKVIRKKNCIEFAVSLLGLLGVWVSSSKVLVTRLTQRSTEDGQQAESYRGVADTAA